VPRPSGKIRTSLFTLASSTANQRPSGQSPSLQNARRLEVSGGWSMKYSVMNISEDQSRPTLKDAFDALRKSEAQLRAFIDELPALAWCLLPDGSIEFFNRQWHTYTGLSAEEMCGSGWKSAERL
jgi:PAS domain-containing protein